MMHQKFATCLFLLVTLWACATWAREINSAKDEKYMEIFTPYRQQMKNWLNNLMTDKDPPRLPKADYITCEVCQVAYPVIVENLEMGATTEEIIQFIIRYCVILEIEEEEICDPTVRSYAAPILYIIQNRPDMTMNDLCGILNPGCTPVNETLTSWQIDIDEAKPPIQALPQLPAGLEFSKILHLTDVHIDVNYTVGFNAACGKPDICCRPESGPPELPEDASQAYGDYRCALPPLAYEAMLEHATTVHGDIKYIFLTGDYVHSGIWLYNEEENSRNIRYVTEKLAETFPNTPVYPLVGNHEPAPVNMYSPEELWDEFDLSWMYEVVAAPFSKWLGQEQLTTFKKGGYYVVKPEPGLRLVIVNTNLCYVNNFWLAYDPIDPTGQLQWFADTMLEAEREGDSVYILGHISPGSSSCWPVWSDHFDNIVNRFENIIRGQFYGHSHTDYFALTFERGTERPTGSLWVGPSGTTDGMNSGYKIYQVDGERSTDSTWEIADHETWILNTTQSNANNVPIFEKLYSAKEVYGLDSLRADELYDFVLRMVRDDALFLKFEWNYNKGLTTRGVCDPEGDDFQQCKLGLLCELVTAYGGDFSHCDKLQEIIRKV